MGFAFSYCAETLFELNTYKQAINFVESDLWIKAMDREINSLNKNNNWTLVDKPNNKKLVDCKWLFCVKPGIKGFS